MAASGPESPPQRPITAIAQLALEEPAFLPTDFKRLE